MKKNILILVSLVLTLFTAQAQEAKTLFVNMPDSITPLLTSINRADCIDFIESNMKAQVQNRFDKTSQMTVLGKDYISIQMTPATTWQMKVLTVGESTKLVCVVSTACGSACDSDIQFYTTDWKLVPASTYLTLPTMDDFFIAPSDEVTREYNLLRNRADMLLMRADFSTESDNLTITLTTTDYMDKEAAEKLKPFLRRPLVYNWTGTFTAPSNPY